MKPIARKEDLVIQEVGGEILVYDLRTNKAICLNQTSALIWQNCDGKKDAHDIARNIEKTLGATVGEDFVWFAVNQLKEESLLESEIVIDKFDGMSRREVIRKIGLGSVIALPVVASLVAPTAAFALSCGSAGGTNQPVGCPCNGNGNCVNNGGSGMSCINNVCV